MADTKSRRFVYRSLLKLMGVVGLGFVAYALLGSLLTGRDEGRPPVVTVDLSTLEPGAMLVQEWTGRDVLVLHRTESMLAALRQGEAELQDPASQTSRQPPGAANQVRARRPQYFVAIAQGTDLNCPLRLVTDPSDWPGGFVDRCRGSRYDFAGRVLAGQEAQRNLAVPPHHFDGRTLVIGRSETVSR